MFFPNVPGTRFIPGATSIPESIVINVRNQAAVEKDLQTSSVYFYIELQDNKWMRVFTKFCLILTFVTLASGAVFSYNRRSAKITLSIKSNNLNLKIAYFD